MHDTIKALETPRLALRITFGLVPLLAGLDKFTYLLTDWSKYVSPFARSVLPVAPETFLYVAGIVEILVGLAVLTRWAEIGGYVAAAWLTLVAGNLILAGYLDVAVRDLAMAVAAFTLARLTAVHDATAVGAEARSAAGAQRIVSEGGRFVPTVTGAPRAADGAPATRAERIEA